MKILAFTPSLRRESHNRQLIELAAGIAREGGATVDLADFSEFDMPLYNGDIEAESGLPEGARELVRRVEGADGIMIASPEYNYSLPGVLKNAIDWISRARPMPLRGKSGLVMAASTSHVGGIRGLWQLRIPLEGLGVFLHPDMYTLPHANLAFDQEGKLKDEGNHQRLHATVMNYLAVARQLAPAHV